MNDSVTQIPRKRLTREESRQQTKLQLLEAAKILFATKGFEATSVDDVAEAAGYSRGALYSNYAGKAELLIALIEQCFDADMQGLEAVTHHISDPKVRGKVILEQFATVDVSLEALLLQQEFWICALRYPAVQAVMSAQLERLHTGISRLMARQIQDMHLEIPANLDDIVVSLVSLRNGLMAQRHIHNDPRFLETHQRMFSQIIGIDLSV